MISFLVLPELISLSFFFQVSIKLSDIMCSRLALIEFDVHPLVSLLINGYFMLVDYGNAMFMT